MGSINQELPEEDHKLAKKAAAIMGKTLKEYIVEAVHSVNDVMKRKHNIK